MVRRNSRPAERVRKGVFVQSDYWANSWADTKEANARD